MLTFKHKTNIELKNMSYEEKSQYYLEYKEYILNLPFDEEKLECGEKKFLKTADFLVSNLKKHFEPHIYGNDKPLNGATIVISNHLGSFDQILVNAPYQYEAFHYMIDKSLLKAKNLCIGNFYVNRGAFVVDKHDFKDIKMAEPRALQYLHRNKHVMMFPEGSRMVKYGSDGGVTKFKKGVIEIAKAGQVPIRPMAINNNYKKGEVYINVGEDIWVSYDDNNHEKLAEVQRSVENLWQENKDKGAMIITKRK